MSETKTKILAFNHTAQDVVAWVRDRFGDEYLNDRERMLRLLEECLELAQAIGITKSDVVQMSHHVYRRPVGDPYAELGGVMITLEALAGHLQTDLAREANREWSRLQTIDPEKLAASVKRKTDAGLVHTIEL